MPRLLSTKRSIRCRDDSQRNVRSGATTGPTCSTKCDHGDPVGRSPTRIIRLMPSRRRRSVRAANFNGGSQTTGADLRRRSLGTVGFLGALEDWPALGPPPSPVAEAQHTCNVLGRRDDGGPDGLQTSTAGLKQTVLIFGVAFDTVPRLVSTKLSIRCHDRPDLLDEMR